MPSLAPSRRATKRARSRITPRKLQTLSELRSLQRLAGAAIMRSLNKNDGMQATWLDGRDTASVIEGFIKPNDRLTSFERIEIYNRQYWYRLIDIVYDDYPGVLAVIGNDRFRKMARAYLAEFPSRSFTLRNLGSHMPEFFERHPEWGRPHVRMAQDMARFEWAQTVAFDGPAKPPISSDDLAGKDPRKIRLALQPYLGLLEMAYPLDEFTMALRKSGLRNEASNAIAEEKGIDEQAQGLEKASRVPRPRPRKTFVAVHRLDNDLYFKRLDPPAFAILKALDEGRTLAQACALVAGKVKPATLGGWFTDWTSLGWFCRRT
jgi:hypothetical protein